MTKNILKSIIQLSLIGSLVVGCVPHEYAEPPFDCVDPSLVANKDAQGIYDASSGTTAKYLNNDIIEAYVTSSDEEGNFYKTISMQTKDGSRGFSVSIDDIALYTNGFSPGTKVFVKMQTDKDTLYTAIPSSYARGLMIGAIPTSIQAVDRIAKEVYKSHLIPSCTKVSEEELVQKITFADISEKYLNTLVEFSDVQFADEAIGSTFDFPRTDNYDTSQNISFGVGQSLVLRTSRYASFAGDIMPAGRGKIRGVLTRYNSTYQIVIRSTRDIQFTNPRIDVSPAIVGANSGVFSSNFVEDFETSTTAQSNFANYINDAFVGSRYWEAKSYNSNKYIQLSSFGSGGKNNTYFLVPVDFTGASNFSFKSNVGYFTGKVLNVYYVLATDYTAGGALDTSKMTNITTNFTIPILPTTGYGTSFTNSGVYAIPTSLIGNGYFVFEYAGNAAATPALTTTMQLDNISVN